MDTLTPTTADITDAHSLITIATIIMVGYLHLIIVITMCMI